MAAPPESFTHSISRSSPASRPCLLEQAAVADHVQRQVADAELVGDADGGRGRTGTARQGRGPGGAAQERSPGKRRARCPFLVHGTSCKHSRGGAGSQII